MDILHGRSKGNCIQTFDLLIEKTTFQTCMDRFYFRSVSEQLFVRIYHNVTQFGFFTVLPCRVVALCYTVSAQKFAEVANLCSQCIFCTVNAASHTADNFAFFFVQHQNTRVDRCLYQSFDGTAHFLDAIWHLYQEENNLFLTYLLQSFFGCLTDFFHSHGNAFIGSGIFRSPVILKFLCCSKNCFFCFFICNKNSF